MRVVAQRVSRACVRVDGSVVGQIDRGLVVLLGIHVDDQPSAVEFLADKLLHLRIFPDDDDKMNRSIIDIGGELLVVSQFTLYGDCRKGRRPSFVQAARPETAIPLYEEFVARLKASGLKIATGSFGAMMQVELTNDGPVTMIIDSPAPDRRSGDSLE